MDYNQKILIVDPIHQKLLSYLKKNYDVTVKHPVSREELLNSIADYGMLILRSGAKVDKALLDKGKALHTIIRAGTGTDNIDLAAVSDRGIGFYNTPSTNSRAVAELSFGMMHCLYRHITRASNEIRNNIWDKKSLLGFELSHKKIGLVGFGSIAKEIADIARGYHMDIHCTVSNYTPARASQLHERNITLHADIKAMFKACDIVVVCCPYTEATHGLINAQALACLNPHAILVNVARGGVINEADLYDALKEKQIWGAASDVFVNERQPSPLFDMNNFIGTPHIGAMSHESQQKIADLIIQYLQKQSHNSSTGERVTPRLSTTTYP
ncbi:hydroxyacid dehydrogenase [Erwinia sp. 9145]|uniref:hydroxyacid dehydrogenase n=1 Tax=Erwinia sp. 9145 TaxID=1500895 RepID=UPI00068C7C91|nr:hydroxyacid dehydrogenase [Erwinia sp. 9145]